MSILRYFLFDNDCIQGSFSDGVTITIYNDQCVYSSSEDHNVKPQRNLMIFTRQNVRKYVLQVLEYLNQHVEHPYLVDYLLPSDKETFWTNAKIQTVSWHIQDSKRIWSNGLDAGIQIKSKERNASITLSPNGKLLKIVFPALVHQMDLVLEKKGVQTESKFNLHGKYQYIWQVQYFSVHSFPSRWNIPVSMLLLAYSSLFSCNHTTLPSIPTETGRIDPEEIYTTELPRTKDALIDTENIPPSEVNNVLSISDPIKDTNPLNNNPNPVVTSKGKSFSLGSMENFISRVYHQPLSVTRAQNTYEPLITFNRTAKTFESNILLEFTSNYTYKYLGDDVVEILNHNDQNCIVILANQIVHYTFNMKESLPSEKCYSISHVPEYVYYFERQDLSISSEKCFVSKKFHLRQLVTFGRRFNSIASAQEKHLRILFSSNARFSSSGQTGTTHPNGLNASQFQGSTVLDPPIVSADVIEEMTIEQVGNFVLFRDERVRGRFEDRTILTITPQQICTIVDRLGNMSRFTSSNIPNQFLYYVNHCLEFKRWALLSEIERQVELQHIQDEEELLREGTFLRDMVADTIQFYGDDSYGHL